MGNSEVIKRNYKENFQISDKLLEDSFYAVFFLSSLYNSKSDKKKLISKLKTKNGYRHQFLRFATLPIFMIYRILFF